MDGIGPVGLLILYLPLIIGLGLGIGLIVFGKKHKWYPVIGLGIFIALFTLAISFL
jgi:hypothetical protein